MGWSPTRARPIYAVSLSISSPRRLSAAAARVTGVAVGAVIDVVSHARVPWIRLRLRVAIGAYEDRIIIGIGIAGGKHPLGIAVIRREPRVIERRPGPCRRGVTRLTGGGETGRRVVRVRRALVQS